MSEGSTILQLQMELRERTIERDLLMLTLLRTDPTYATNLFIVHADIFKRTPDDGLAEAFKHIDSAASKQITDDHKKIMQAKAPLTISLRHYLSAIKTFERGGSYA